jgi:hypothetical protein
MYHYTINGQTPEANAAAADQLCRYVVSNLAAGCDKVFLYSMHSHGHFGPSSWRTIVTAEGYMHPAGAGHSAMAWELEDTRFVRRIPVAQDVYAYLFEARDGSRSIAVLAPRPGAPIWAPPSVAGMTLRDVFGNPLGPDRAVAGALVYASAAVPARRLEMMLVGE